MNSIMDFPYQIRHSSDHFFKYMIEKDKDTRSIDIRKIIIEEGLCINYFETKLLNPNLIPKNADKKNMYLDALLEDEHHRFIHLEMQRSAINKEHKARMSAYGNKIIIDKLEADKPYNNGIEVYQCIFVDDGQIHKTMKETCKKVNEHGEEYGVGMVYTTFIYVSYIDEVLKYKQLNELTRLECILYVFRYGIGYDILRLGKEVVKIMAEKMEEYVSDYAKILEKRSYEDFERYQVWMKREIERLEKQNLTSIQKIEAISKEKDAIAEENNELKQSRIKMILKLINKHGLTLEDALEALEIPDKQAKELKELIQSIS